MRFGSVRFLIADNLEVKQNIFRTQQQINSYARQGLRVLVMAKRLLTESEFNDWLKAHKEVELCRDNRDKLMASYSVMESKLILLGESDVERDTILSDVPGFLMTRLFKFQVPLEQKTDCRTEYQSA